MQFAIYSYLMTSWKQYLTSVRGDDLNKDLAAKTGISESTISRWKGTPSAEHVIQVARAYHESPIYALMVAGYLTQDEVETQGARPKQIALQEFDDLALAKEIVRRVEAGESTMLNTPLDESHPATNVSGEDNNVTSIDFDEASDDEVAEAKQKAALKRKGAIKNQGKE